jgi:cellulose synthase/poly-beta-1,6-N-acetylglucosamine synthase-like glycosyltransferase
MLLAYCILLLVLSISFFVQAILAWGYARVLSQFQRPLLPDAECPSAFVILCLRGGDPFLDQCLHGLLHLDYPNYRVLVVVDHPSDPSMPVIRAALHEHTNADPNDPHERSRRAELRILELESPLESCSLKCSSLLQAVSELPEGTEFVALLDADTIPHRTWLRELATALQPSDVGAATGNRWYMPNRLSLAATVRYLWNAAAIVQMYWYGIAWGGTLAIKTQTLRQAKMIEDWSQSLCEDTPIARELARTGQRLVFVPSLMMVNREDCRLRPLRRWVSRQLMLTRLYHASWPAVVFHGFNSIAILLLGWGWGVVMLVLGEWAWALGIGGAMLLYQLGLMSLLPCIERQIERIARARDEDCSWRKGLQWHWLVRCVIATQVFYTWALLRALTDTAIEWRGIVYSILPAGGIQRGPYRPFRDINDGPACPEERLSL